MIEKFSSQKHANLLPGLPFKYESSAIYLDFDAYVIERNGETNIVVQDVVYPNDFPYLYLPEKEENWEYSLILWATKEQLEELKQKVEIVKSFSSGKEFYYKTKEFIDLEGEKWKKFRKDVHYFKNHFKFSVKETYPESEVKSFLKNIWLKEQDKKTASFDVSYNFFLYCLDNQEKYNIKTLYVEIDGALAGLAMGAKFNDSMDKWLALHIKVDYEYRGLSRFLYHQRAKQFFSDSDEFTSGATCVGDEGIEQFKQHLNPSKISEYFYVVTGKKLTTSS